MSGSLGLTKGWEQERRVCDGKRTAGDPGIGRCFCLACTSGDVVLGFCKVSPLAETGKGAWDLSVLFLTSAGESASTSR